VNETKHTPGPWRWEPNHCASDDRPCGSITAPDSVRPWLELAYLQGHPGLGFMADECLANVHLIVAAPDLLEACKVASALLKGLPRSLGYDLDATQLDAAIAKATKESP